MGDTRNKYKAYIPTILQDAGYADPQGAAGRIIDLETKIAKAHETREQSEDFANGAKVWTRPSSSRRRRASTGRAARTPRSSAMRRSSTPIMSPRSQAGRAGRLGTAAELEGLAGIPHSSTSRRTSCPRHSATRTSPSTGRRSPGRRSSARATCRAQRDQQRAPGRGRQGLCRQIFPGLVQGRNPEDGRQYQGRLRAAACRQSAGCRRRPRKRR